MKNGRNRLFVALLVFGFQELEAQTGGTISGTVIDAVTLKPLAGANIVVKETRYGAAADSAGSFEVKAIPPGTYVVEFRHVGYRTKFRVVNVMEGESAEFTITLDEDPIRLPEVTVTDTVNLERMIHQYPRSNVVTRDMLLDTKTESIAAALRLLVPRFDVSVERTPERRRPVFGAPPFQVQNILLLIDGRRVHPLGEDVANDPNWLDKYVDIQEVEAMVIHRGDDAWIRAGRRGERLDWLIEITRRR